MTNFIEFTCLKSFVMKKKRKYQVYLITSTLWSRLKVNIRSDLNFSQRPQSRRVLFFFITDGEDYLLSSSIFDKPKTNGPEGHPQRPGVNLHTVFHWKRRTHDLQDLVTGKELSRTELKFS